MSRKLISLFAAVVIVGAAIVPASADTPAQSVRVSYADLDLTRVEGVTTLTVRLEKAIDKVCGRIDASRPLNTYRTVKTCRIDAMNKAIASIDAPLLTKQFAGL
jgi:UrcA family protein